MASVVGTLARANADAFQGAVTFRPLDGPKVLASGTLMSSGDITVYTNETGALAATLSIGRYRVFWGECMPFLINVVDPVSPATTVDIKNLIIPGA